MSSQSMNGLVDLSWQEVDSWLSCSQRELTIWEVGMIKDMSRAYVSEYNSASDRARPMPYREETIKVDRQAVSKGFAAMFAQLKVKE